MALPDPINEWKFSDFVTDGGQKKVKDLRGTLDAVIDNFVSAPGRSIQVLKFSKAGGAQLGYLGGTDLDPPWTMACWVRRDVDSDGATLLSSATYGLRLEQFFQTKSLGATEFNQNMDPPYSGGDFVVGPEGRVDLGTWHFVTVTGEAGVTKFYLDGKQVGAIQQTIKLPRGYVGSSHGVSEILEGSIDQMWLYNCIVDPAALYNQALPPPPPPKPLSWNTIGNAFAVTAMTWHLGGLYVASNSKLWRRSDFTVGSGNAWTEAGDAYGVTGMASHLGDLYVTSGTQLCKRGQLGPGTGNDWSVVGEAHGVTAMASHLGALYATANSQLCKRGALGPGTGNDWSIAGQANSVTGMVSHQGGLIVASNNQLWQRGQLGPSSGNDWTKFGDLASAIALASSGDTLYAVVNSSLQYFG